MKILCVIDSLGSGGAQRQIVELAIGFRERGHEVAFLVYHEENFFRGRLDEARIPINAIIEANYFKRLYKMRKYLRRSNYDAVLSFLEAANFICELAGLPWRKWKLIVGERSTNPRILKTIKLKSYRYFHLFANYVVSNSNANIKLVQKIVPTIHRDKLHVIHNMVDFETFKPGLNYEFKKNNKLTLVVLASHQFLKNLDGLIEATNRLSNGDKQVLKIDWYGDIRDESLSKALNKITLYDLHSIFTFYPATKDAQHILQQADIVGLFSFYEGLPNIICEAMACGKPVLASAVSDIPELLSYDPNILFDPNKNDTITHALIYILHLSEDKLKEIGSTNLEISKVIFDKEKIINKYLKLLIE